MANPSQSVLGSVVHALAQIGEVRVPCTSLVYDVLRRVYPVSVPRVPLADWQIHDIQRPWSNVQAVATAMVGRVGEGVGRGVWSCQGWRVAGSRPSVSAPSGHAFLALTRPGSAGFIVDATEDRSASFRLIDEEWWDQFGSVQGRDERGCPVGLGYALLWRPRGDDLQSDELF